MIESVKNCNHSNKFCSLFLSAYDLVLFFSISYMANPMFLQLKTGTIQEGEKVKVKLSGDGARMSRVSNFT